MDSSSEHPYPPFDLATRVSALPDELAALGVYEENGAIARRELLRILPGDWTFEGKRVLDFGCGAGRTLRHFLAEAEQAEFWGADIDAASIDWLMAHLSPPLHGVRCDPEPPLPLEKTFHFIWAISVFTHLADSSAAWLCELHRRLEPGGLLMASYMGEWNSEVLAGEPWDEDRIGMNVLRRDQSWDQGGPMVLISEWWLREHWGRAFEIVDIHPWIHNQDWALLRKRDVEITPEELMEPGEDPREWAALRHNLLQVQREAAEHRRVGETAIRDGQQANARSAVYEGSSSWRVTGPLRSAAAAVRSARGAAGRASRSN